MGYVFSWLMIGIAGIALVLGGITCVIRTAENRLTLENRSGQSIARLLVTMPRTQVASFKNWPDGGAETVTFQILGGEDSFTVTGSMADGTGLMGNFGYYTNGFYGERPRLVVRKGGILELSSLINEQGNGVSAKP